MVLSLLQVKDFLAGKKGQRLSVSEIRHGMQPLSSFDIKQVSSPRQSEASWSVQCAVCSSSQRFSGSCRLVGRLHIPNPLMGWCGGVVVYLVCA